MAAITKLNDDKSANKHDEVINAENFNPTSSAHPGEVSFATIQTF